MHKINDKFKPSAKIIIRAITRYKYIMLIKFLIKVDCKSKYLI